MRLVISLIQPLIDNGPKQVGRLREKALQPESAGERRHKRLIASLIFLRNPQTLNLVSLKVKLRGAKAGVESAYYNFTFGQLCLRSDNSRSLKVWDDTSGL